MRKNKNLFIALEGIDGSGKSTQTQLLKAKLEAKGHKVYCTFEPTNGPIGKIIRQMFSGEMEADHGVIAGLFVADRLQHLNNSKNGILKMLEDGYTVICDRYLFSSYAYQGAHMNQDWVIEANSQAAAILRPDINIYIDIAPKISMERISKGRDSTELYETLENLEAVYQKYEEAFRKIGDEERVERISGDKPPEGVSQAIMTVLESFL